MQLHNEADEEARSYVECFVMIVLALPIGIAYTICPLVGIAVGITEIVAIVWTIISFRSYPDRTSSPT